MTDEKNEGALLNLGSEFGTGVIGETVTAGIGALVGGPAGIVVGAIAGNAVVVSLKKLAADFSHRYLSEKERQRTQSVVDLTIEQIEENRRQGKLLRDDGFFDKDTDDRSTADEIFEGTLLAAQREYEEKKLPFLARLNASIAFDGSISRPVANQLLKIASELTYRQIQILHVIGLLQFFAETEEIGPLRDARLQKAYTEVSGLESVGIASDIVDLYRRSLVHSGSVMLDAGGINPSTLSLVGYGALLFNLMGLSKEPFFNEDMSDIYGFLTGANSAPDFIQQGGPTHAQG